MENITALILVGGRGTRLQSLTNKKSKSYVSFFGKYRLIDFPLSSLSYSGIKNIGIITQYEPYDLMKYIGNGDSFDLDDFQSGISFLTPYEDREVGFITQKGTANAVLSQIEFIKRCDSKYILILSGDQVYQIDFNEILKSHIKRGAELTIISKEIERSEDLKRYGILELGSEKRVIGFEEKPENPKSNTISLGMYLFSKEYLLNNLKMASTLVDFGRDFIPYLINKKDKVYAYNHSGDFYDLGTVDGLYNANMYYLDNPTKFNNKGDKFKIYSRSLDLPPSYIKNGSIIKNSIVSDGSLISATITHSIISYDVIINEGSKIENSIILPGARIGKNTELKNVIIDENAIVKDNTIYSFSVPTLIEE